MEADRSTISVNTENEESKYIEIDIKQIVLTAVEKWWLLLICAVVAAAIAGVYTFKFVTPLYQATSKIYVVNNKDSAINLSDLQISNYLTSDYQEVFKTWHVHELVLQKLGLNYTYSQIGKMINITNPASTRILYITATSPDPEEAKNIANAYAQVASEYIAQKMDTTQPTIFEEALKPNLPSSPNKTRAVIIAFIIGLLIAILIIVIRCISDDYIRTEQDVEKYVHLPVLGVVMMQDLKPEKSKEKSKK